MALIFDKGKSFIQLLVVGIFRHLDIDYLTICYKEFFDMLFINVKD